MIKNVYIYSKICNSASQWFSSLVCRSFHTLQSFGLHFWQIQTIYADLKAYSLCVTVRSLSITNAEKNPSSLVQRELQTRVGLAESHLRVEYSCLSIYNEWLFQNLSTSLCSKETGQSERTDLNWCISCGGKERLAAWHSICFNSQMPTLSSAKFSEAKSGWKINVFSGPSNCTCQLHAETAAPKQHLATKICKELNSWPVGSKMLSKCCFTPKKWTCV